ncbi:MAG TPA: hypothetical protein VFB43_17035 [Terracidiphilus sp.]|nr:hypothetical protein [Terracidiphilus sp.]
MMTFVPAMWAVWIALAFSFVVLKLYISRLSRDEDDELVLGESLDRIRLEQASLAARLHKVEPIERVVLWVLGATSVFVAVYYIHDMIMQFR